MSQKALVRRDIDDGWGWGRPRRHWLSAAHGDEEEETEMEPQVPVGLADKDINVVIPLATLLELYAQIGGESPAVVESKNGHSNGKSTVRPVTNGNGVAVLN